MHGNLLGGRIRNRVGVEYKVGDHVDVEDMAVRRCTSVLFLLLAMLSVCQVQSVSDTTVTVNWTLHTAPGETGVPVFTGLDRYRQ